MSFILITGNICMSLCSTLVTEGRQVKSVHIIITFLISLEANIAAFYICKWLERNKWQ